jgi:hypothetical protein
VQQTLGLFNLAKQSKIPVVVLYDVGQFGLLATNVGRPASILEDGRV